MNNLHYMNLEDAVQMIHSGDTIPDGTVITAHCASIEATKPDVLLVEAHAESGDWRKRYTNGGVYHYELLVARAGIEDYGRFPGDFRVIGTENGIYDAGAEKA